MRMNKNKEFMNLVVDHVNKAETHEEWEERVKFASGFC